MKRHKNAKFDIETEKRICELYQEGNHNGSPVLAKQFGCNWGTIINILKFYGIPLRNFSTSQIGLQLGEKHPHYKGGNICKGYRRISVNNVVIFEHRYVMEQHLGRKLLPEEIVHHINHDKLDNRIENLQLMTRSEHMLEHFDEIQPKAIEAARQWAKRRRDTLSQMEPQTSNLESEERNT